MPSLSEILRTTATRHPNRDALVFGERTHTYTEFAAKVEKVASVLADHGVKHGDRVLLLSGNSDYFAIAAYGILRTGAIFVPANPRSAGPEVTYLLEDSGAKVLVSSAELASLAGESAKAAGHDVEVLSLGDAHGFENLLATADTTELQALESWPVESDDSMLIYTSGTTGRPKGALFDHHKTIWVGIAMAGVTGLQESERMLHVAPLYHAAELCMLLFPGTMYGATHTILPAFDPTTVANTIADQKITVFFGVPTVYQYLLMVPTLDSLDLSSLRVGLFGAAPMPASVVTKLVEKLPTVDLFQLCGQTEAGPGGIYSNPEDVRLRPDASGARAIPNMEARVVDEDGNDVAPGNVGELILRGETVMKEYWNKPEATASTITPDGWLHTGDLTLIDEDGYMTIVDRLKDMIITGGRNVYSVEVENALMGHPDVADVAILGVPHDEFGESILAVVVPKPDKDVTLESLREFSKTQLADYKAPHHVLLHTIPRNPSGKIQKNVLKTQLADENLTVR